MSILCDLFVGTRDEALAYANSPAAEQAGLGQQMLLRSFNGLTSLEFGTLWAILEEQEWDPDRHELADVEIDDGADVWLSQFPEEYVELLAGYDADALFDAAQTWSETEELMSNVDTTLPVLRALVELANEAIAQRKGLYVWGSL
jgi:hypothetical protein